MKNYILILVLLTSPLIWSQNYKFGKVSKKELEEVFYPLDSTANAAILFTERKTKFEFDKEKGFYIEEKYFTRLKIYNEEAYDKATGIIDVFHNTNGKEEVRNLKAVTYNLENGNILKSKLEKKNIFDERKNKYIDLKKFTLPNLKPGSVVEWEYILHSPFFGNFNEVVLQQDIPIKKLKTRIATPEYFNYKSITKGHLHIPFENERKERTIRFSNFERESGFARAPSSSKSITSEFDFTEFIQTIEMNNIPGIIDEPYSGNINNYMAGVNYELSYIKYPNSPTKHYATDWESVVEKIYNNSSFGGELKKQKHFEEDLKDILVDTKSIDEKIIKIFEFVKQKVKWNGMYYYYSENGIKKAYKEGVGNVADVNLNLVAMLQSIGIKAYPVLISTVNHGIPLFPTRFGFNYVIVRVNTSKGYILLDATEKNAAPNVLPDRALNFRGRVISEQGSSEWVELFPQKHAVKKIVIQTKFDEIGFNGTSRTTLTNNFLLEYRNTAREKNSEELLEWIDENTEGVEVIRTRVTNLDSLNKDVIETLQFETESFYEEINGKIYISPLLYLQLTENPFKSEKREFPVFYDTPWANIYTINMDIPDAYEIKNVPESCEYLLPDNLGSFQYSITPNGKNIEIKSNFIINQPIISPAQYQNLKEFYDSVITKQMEKIVLSKK